MRSGLNLGKMSAMIYFFVAILVMLAFIVGAMFLFDFLADRNKATLGWVIFGLVYAMFSLPILTVVSQVSSFGLLSVQNVSVRGENLNLAAIAGVGIVIWIAGLFGLGVLWRDRSLGFTIAFAAGCALFAFGADTGETLNLPVPTTHETVIYGLVGIGFFGAYFYFREPRDTPSVYRTMDVGYSSELQRTPKAELAILHRPDVASAWDKIQVLGGEWPRRFLDEIEKDPRVDPLLAVTQVGDDLGETYPFAPDDVAAAYSLLSGASSNARQEFRTTLYTLAGIVNPATVAASILEHEAETVSAKLDNAIP